MLGSLCDTFKLREGKDYIISKRDYITCLYFKDLLMAQCLREQVSNKADLKEINLAVISKVIRRKNAFGYFFFVSEKRVI